MKNQAPPHTGKEEICRATPEGTPERDLLLQKRTYSTAEFSKPLGVSTKKVTAWIRTGRIRVIKDLRPYAIPASELQRVLAGGFINER